MLEELLNVELYNKSLQSAVSHTLDGWGDFAGVNVRLELDEQVASPLAYETENNSIYVFSMSCCRYAYSERDNPDTFVAASYSAILEEARSACPKDSAPVPFDSDWRLFVAFSILHEIGHCHTWMSNPRYAQLEEQHKARKNRLPKEASLRATAYRELPLEKCADKFAKKCIERLCESAVKVHDAEC